MSDLSTTTATIGFVSLGCPKALVDSERILTQLRTEGYEVAPDYDGADLVVVNTCGFIDAAIEESFDAIGEALSANGQVVVTGCLGARAESIRERFPDVLAVTGPHEYEAVLDAVHAHLPRPHDPFVDLLPPQGIKLTPRHYAYLKISEGCNHKCSFCIIPSMRGRLASRRPDDVLREAEHLVESGVRELLVISQDTSAYGTDIRRGGIALWHARAVKPHITSLADALGDLGVWTRLHYVYPYPHVDELIPLMAAGRLLPYLDMPLQHASPTLLKSMRRPAAVENTFERLRRWREQVPDITVRSTFITGFPGETDEDFEALLAFLREAEIDRAGCFAYSPVEGAAANALPDHVPAEVAEARREQFMAVQAEVSAAKLARKIGSTQRVLVDAIDEEGNAIARSSADAPEIDGVVVVAGGTGLPVGEFADVLVTDSDEHDLYGALP